MGGGIRSTGPADSTPSFDAGQNAGVQSAAPVAKTNIEPEPAQLPPLNAATERHLPAPKKQKFTIVGMAPILFGKSIASVAVAAAIIGSMLGSPEAARVPRGATPTQITQVARTPGTQVNSAERAFSTISRLVSPSGVNNREVLDAVGYISFSVVLDRGHLLPDGETEGLEIRPGTRLTAYLSREGITFQSSPGLNWRVDWMPDPQIHSLRYSFREARFTSDASGFGPDGIYENLVDSRANEHLIQRLPPAMRQPGYNPFSDPNLDANIQSFIDSVSATSDPSTGAARDPDFSRLSAPQVSFDLSVPRDMTFPLEGGYTAFIDAGTRVDVSFNGTGAANDPRLQNLRIHFSEPMVIGKGNEKPRGFGNIDLHSISIGAGGQIEADYELGPEQAIDGLRALFTIIAASQDARYANNLSTMERTRMNTFREEIQQKIDGTVEPRLAEFLREHEGEVPGFSLLRFFGIATEPAR